MRKKIKIKRASNKYYAKLRKIEIFSGEKKLLELNDNESKTIELTEDTSEIYAKLDWLKSNQIQIISDNSEVVLKVKDEKFIRQKLVATGILLIASYFISFDSIAGILINSFFCLLFINLIWFHVIKRKEILQLIIE